MSRLNSQPDELIPPHLIGLILTPDEFERLCPLYRDLRLELASTGELIVMPPTDTKTGMHNANLTYQLAVWTKQDATGIGFGASAGFHLANGAIRAPSVSWIKREKWDRLTQSQKEGFGPICPDFVVELRAYSDDLPPLLEKMEEYMASGATLGWLIDPQNRQVHVYKAGEETIILQDPAIVSGDPLLPGFELRMEEIW